MQASNAKSWADESVGHFKRSLNCCYAELVGYKCSGLHAQLQNYFLPFLPTTTGGGCFPQIKSYTAVGSLSLVVCAEQADTAATWLAEQVSCLCT